MIEGREYDSKAIAGAAHGFLRPFGQPLPASAFSGGERTVARTLRALGFDVVRRQAAAEFREPDNTPALALPLHGETSRKAAYELFRIEFDQRKRHLTRGLSPRLPDGGYFIFVTLDKSELDDTYDYEDQLYPESLEWVSRRGVTEADDDYVASGMRRHESRCLSEIAPEMRLRTSENFGM